MTSAIDRVSDQRHAPAALYSPGKGPPVPIGQEAGWAPEMVWTQRLEGKTFAPAGDRIPVVQFVVIHYTELPQIVAYKYRHESDQDNNNH
jgi:hypothetical protein